MARDPLKEAIQAAGSGSGYPVMKLVSDPGLASLVSKMVEGRYPGNFDVSGNRKTETPDAYMLQGKASRTAQNISDAETIMQLLPDMELSAQILISSILSPKDMMATELTFGAPEGIVSPDIAAALIARLRQHFEQDYKIKDQLSRMLRDVLFETGSYAVAVLPENSLDEMINGQQKISMEAVRAELDKDGSVRPIGLLGPVNPNKPNEIHSKARFSLESYDDQQVRRTYDSKVTLSSDFNGNEQETFITVVDNPNLLKFPRITERLREDRIKKIVGATALEANTPNLTDRDLASKIYRARKFTYSPIAMMKTQDELSRRSVGNPLILHIPSEAVLPVYVPGSPNKHIGYFILIDEEGNPINRVSDNDHYSQLNSRLRSNSSFTSAMIQKVQTNMNGFDLSVDDHLNMAARTYGSMVEKDLLSRLRNGIYGSGVEIAKKDEIYRVMLSRSLAQMNTQILFLPIELMTYFAFRFTSDGIGKSLLDEMKILSSLRVMLMFANVMAAVKNSIGRTEVKVKLDESDPDPMKAIERVTHDIVRSRQQGFPVGTNSPMDIVDWLGRAGMEFTYEGHPGLPDVRVDFGEKSSSYVKPDTDLEEELRKRSVMKVGLTPETIDSGYQAELATSVVTNNILLSKRVMRIQEMFTPLLNDHLRKVAMNSEGLITDLRKILEDNIDKIVQRMTKDEKVDKTEIALQLGNKGSNVDDAAKQLIIQETLNSFVMQFEVDLPKPNSVTLENQMVALETYTKALESAIEAYVSDTFMNSDTAGDISQHVETLKGVIKAHYIRKWMAENGVLPELAELITVDEDGKPAVNIYKEQSDHIGALTKSLAQFMKFLEPVKQAANTVEADMRENDNGSGSGSSSSYSSSDTSSEDSSSSSDSEDDMGMGDLGDLDSMGLDETESGDNDATDETTASGEKETPTESEEKPAE